MPNMGDNPRKQEATDSRGQICQRCHVCALPGDRFAFCPSPHATCKTCFAKLITENVMEDELLLSCGVKGCAELINLDSCRPKHPINPQTVVLYETENVPHHTSQATILFTAESVRKDDSENTRCPECQGPAEYREKTQLYECPDELCRLVQFSWWKSSIPNHEGPIQLLDVRDTEAEAEAQTQQEQKVMTGSSQAGPVDETCSNSEVILPLNQYPNRDTGSQLPLLSSGDPRNPHGAPASWAEMSDEQKMVSGSSQAGPVDETISSSETGCGVTLPLNQYSDRETGSQLPLLSSGDPRNPHAAPASWAGMSDATPYLAMEVGVESREARGIRELLKFCPRRVNRVIRIQNRTLWGRYCIAKQTMKTGLPSTPNNEKFVFRAVRRDKLSQVLEFGWNDRFPEGLQFVLRPEVFGSCETPIVVSQCLAGLWTNGNPVMTAPPPRREGGHFHSIVNDKNNLTWIKMFDRSRVYPSYIVY